MRLAARDAQPSSASVHAAARRGRPRAGRNTRLEQWSTSALRRSRPRAPPQHPRRRLTPKYRRSARPTPTRPRCSGETRASRRSDFTATDISIDPVRTTVRTGMTKMPTRGRPIDGSRWIPEPGAGYMRRWNSGDTRNVGPARTESRVRSPSLHLSLGSAIGGVLVVKHTASGRRSWSR